MRPTLYATLRDDCHWELRRQQGVEISPDGAIQLARVPAPRTAIDLDGPFDVAPSGIAIGACGDLFFAETDSHRVVWADGICGAQVELPRRIGAGNAPGQFHTPAALLIISATLYVADSGNARLQLFRVPTLEPCADWTGTFLKPTDLAVDSRNRIYVLDRGLGSVLRLSALGIADGSYNTAVATRLAGTLPTFIAVDGADTLYVAEEHGKAILRFDSDGNSQSDLPLTGAVLNPGALAINGGRLYVADVDSGNIRIFDLATQQYIGDVFRWRGPVTAMALDDNGTLYVKPAHDKAVHQLTADSGCVDCGQVESGPLDAGYSAGWFRVKADIDQPSRAGVELQTFVANDLTSPPATENDWTTLPSFDSLLPQSAVSGMSELQGYRYLWLRVRMKSDGQANPRIRQIQAATPGEDYMDYLPAVYRRKDDGFLRRWLAVFQAELGDLEQELADMPRRFNAATAPAGDLDWLASWLAFDPPSRLSTAELRSFLQRISQLYQRRGTCAGLREWVRLYADVSPLVVESYRARHVWQLGHTSLLGLDTALASLAPHGMIVPDSATLDHQNCDTDAPTGCSVPEQLVVGAAVVGQSGPLAAGDLGEPLFDESAHHFSVWVPANKVAKPEQRDALRRILDAEKPCHTHYKLCIVEPRMRVGLQAHIGIDSYVAGPPESMSLNDSVIGLNAHLGEQPGDSIAGRIGRHDLLGANTILA